MGKSSSGLSYAASYPCTCWHFNSALYFVVGDIPRVLRGLIRMVLPQAMDNESGSFSFWLHLV